MLFSEICQYLEQFDLFDSDHTDSEIVSFLLSIHENQTPVCDSFLLDVRQHCGQCICLRSDSRSACGRES